MKIVLDNSSEIEISDDLTATDLAQTEGEWRNRIQKWYTDNEKEIGNADKAAELERMFTAVSALGAEREKRAKSESFRSRIEEMRANNEPGNDDGNDGDFEGGTDGTMMPMNHHAGFTFDRSDSRGFVRGHSRFRHGAPVVGRGGEIIHTPTALIPHEYTATKEFNDHFSAFLRCQDPSDVPQETKEYLRASTVKNKSQWGDANGHEYIVAPMQFHSAFLRGCDQLNFIRNLATIIPTSNLGSLGIRRRTQKTSSFSWGCVCAPPLKTDPGIGLKVLNPHHYSAGVEICRDILRRTAFDMQGFLATELALEVADELEKVFMLGDGDNKPLGLFTESNSGIGADRDLATLNVGSIVSDDLICMLMNLKQVARQRNLSWILPSNMLKAVMLLKDGEGQYLWRAGLRDGFPDMLLGYRVYETDAFTSTMASGSYAAMLGDIASYWIADGPRIGLESKTEILDDSICWVLRGYIDAMPVEPCHFTRLKIQ